MLDIKKMAFFVLVVLGACTNNQQNSSGNCKTESACLNDPNCLCWCSVKCGYRKKTNQDSPIYIKNDRNGKFCYCKEWDYEEYKNNCILGKEIEQPKGAR